VKFKSHTPYPIPNTLVCILLISLAAHALPVGDPRTPDENSSKAEIPVEQGVHEISLHAFMGASKIDYPDMTGTQFSPGFGAAFTYGFFFSPKWSFIAGGGLQLFNNRGTDVNGNFSDVLREANDFADDGDGRVMLYYDFRDYSETQWSMMLMFPIMFQYQTNATRNKAFYYALGVKLGFPFAGGYRGTSEHAAVCGWYPGLWGMPGQDNFNYCNREGYGEGYEDLGFGDYGKVTSNSKLKLGTAFFAAAEAGVKWRLYNKLAVYTGFWLDWGLNDVAIRAVGAEPIAWTPTKGNEGDKNTPKGEITFRSRTEGKAIPVSLGFTFRVALGAKSHRDLDSTHWIREIAYRDSLLALCNAREDSLAALARRADELLDSLIACRGACSEEAISKDALKRRLDSLEALRKAELERARQDSLERARRALEASKAERLANFRRRLGSIVNGLDDYKITQTVPSSRAAEKLDTAGVLLRDYPDLKIRITGHTCDRGTHETNLRIGIQRAQSAKNYLINNKGIDASRIETATKAESEPVVQNTSEEQRRKNRRVQIEIIEGIEKAEQEVK